jgi:hypothetical protein
MNRFVDDLARTAANGNRFDLVINTMLDDEYCAGPKKNVRETVAAMRYIGRK